MLGGGCCNSGNVEFLVPSDSLKLKALAGVCPGRLDLMGNPTCKKKMCERL